MEPWGTPFSVGEVVGSRWLIREDVLWFMGLKAQKY